MTARLHRLTNGVRVACDPMPGLQTLALSVVAGRGSRSEGERELGWSHLLEHMVFKGTSAPSGRGGAGQRSARDIVEVIEAEGGSINAATGHERTSFQVRALAGGLPLALDVVADLMLRPALDAGDLEREKKVIAQEIAEADDTPDDRVFELAGASAYAGQALGRPILGTEASLAPADPAALAAWRTALYAPDRLVVSAAGAVDEDELLALAERAFGHLAGEGAAEPEPAQFVGGAATEARRLEQAHLVFLLPGVGVRDPAYYPQRVFAELLGGGMSSRLFQEARERLGLAYAVDAYAETYSDAGVLGIYAGAAAADAAALARTAAAETVGLAERVEQAELKRAKAQLKAQLFMAREQPATRAESGAGQALLFDRLFDPAEQAAEIEAVTPTAVQDYGRAALASGRSTSAVLGPKRALAAAETFGRALG